ncbi:hypothetical protein [Gilvimarinus sp. 1_MG-2023]|uniref:hypothetical protein n=1 Tax=Gilvimarinus sp. 1_MG-2023 TaxID=3062638 RepID=UPI0026E38D28|nr:hypothetical protein [Gilvimarinus sp. 1_MG-2023]MDO6746936.1 hypothetical protein [Gilvimarinus sp. 1_MG-2023]
MEETNDNKDLVWDLDTFSQRQKAVSFVMGFENKLCVYSSSVRQLYTNYNIFFPKEESRKLVILPNPYAPHDTYNGIPTRSVTASGLHILPDSAGALQLTLPLKRGTKAYRKVPLRVGLRMVEQRLPEGKSFLPVLMKGDLREMDATTPCLHLHFIHLERLESHSVLEQTGIRKVIESHLNSLC